MKIEIQLDLPCPEIFQRFRSDVSWGPLSLKQAEAALAGSIGGIIAKFDDKTVGLARYVGDGVLNIYIQDVIVLEKYRNQGVGQTLMIALIQHLTQTYPKDCRVGLFAAEGQDRFYKRLGFSSRPESGFGPGMHATLSELAKPSNAA
jgi:GNAT superfamily N-acetyltransferase